MTSHAHTRKHRRLHKMRQRSGSRVTTHRLQSGRTGDVHDKRTPSKQPARGSCAVDAPTLRWDPLTFRLVPAS